MIRDIIRQMVEEELNGPRWIADASHIVIGKSPWKGDRKLLGTVFPVQITGISVNDYNIVASVTLPNGPSTEMPKPHLVVAINPLRQGEYSPPTMWGNMQKLFMGKIMTTLTEEGNVVCLTISNSSRADIIQSVIHMGYNIKT